MYLAAPFFDGAVLTAPASPWSPAQDAAIKRFMRLNSTDRLAASRHVLAYYRDIHKALDGRSWLDARMPRPRKAETIWRHVRPQRLLFLGDDPLFLAIEARVPWDEALGLMMVWQGGDRLVKVGGYDGQPLNTGAEPEVVYRAADPALTTRQVE